MLYAFQDNGDGSGTLLEATCDMDPGRHDLFRANAARNGGVPAESVLLWSGPELAGRVRAVIAGGVVSGAQTDPAWTPPVPPADPLSQLRAEVGQLSAVVNATLPVSEHDRRWLAQKEGAKRLGIAWIKAHPACAQAEAEEALAAALAAELSEEPLVISPAGVMASYALAAHGRGYIPEASFTALRDLVAAASQEQLVQLLAKL